MIVRGTYRRRSSLASCPHLRRRSSFFVFMASKRSEKDNPSPYTQVNIIKDDSVRDLAAELREKRPALRPRSKLLRKLPFNNPQIVEVESLYEWISQSPKMKEMDLSKPDFVLVMLCSLLFLFYYTEKYVQELAKFMDWDERTGIYRDPGQGKDRRKNKEVRLLIRRFGLEEANVTPAPHEFLRIQSQANLVWTETHQRLYLLRFLDVLVDLRDMMEPPASPVAPDAKRLLALSSASSAVC